MLRRSCFPALVLLAVVLTGCETTTEIDVSRDIDADPLGDITLLDDIVYATNNDASGHAGSQVDLMRFAVDGTPLEATPVALNGQGYMSACSDGQDIYLQSRASGQLFRLTLGGIAWTRRDAFVSDQATAGVTMLARGIAYAASEDSFVILYQEADTNLYTTRRIGPDFEAVGSSTTFAWETFAPTSADVITVTWHDGRLWAIGAGGDGYHLQGVDTAGAFTTSLLIDTITEPVCGLGSTATGLLIATENRHFHARSVP